MHSGSLPDPKAVSIKAAFPSPSTLFFFDSCKYSTGSASGAAIFLGLHSDATQNTSLQSFLVSAVCLKTFTSTLKEY